MTSCTPVMQSGDHEGTLACWWTQNDLSTDFCIVLCDDSLEGHGVSFNLSYGECKRLYNVLNKKLKGAEYYDE